jgi:very-short-patch-repair endonuclease
VLSQTSLGEIIGSEDQKAFNSINSKRVDILVMNAYGEPIAAIEYQGGAHHQGTAAARDAIKREALRRAGVQFIEVLSDHTPDEIAQLVRRIFREATPVTSTQQQRPSLVSP